MFPETLVRSIARVAKGEITSPELVKLYLERIRRFDAELNAFTWVDESCEGRPGVLGGVPIAVKDLLDVAGQVTTAASNLFKENLAPRDASVIAQLRSAGAAFIGRTNLHEFAYGGSGMISNRGPARNPWDTSRITGGSSSGSAAAVAAGLCAAAIGTDTAGSIRLPASLCGIVGFKPTYGAVSTDGVIPLSESYDHAGPMARTVEDARILFGAMVDSQREAQAPKVLRVGVPEKYFYRDLEAEIGAAMSSAIERLRQAGHAIRRVDFDVDEDRTLSSYEVFQFHSKNVARSPELYQPETLRRIRSGEQITREAAEAAKEKLRETRARAAEIFIDIDILLTPTVPILAPKIDDFLAKPETLRPQELLMLRNTRPFNVLGTPAISLPWELSADGLPIGIQVAAAPGKDFELLAMAEKLEEIAPWQGRTAPALS